jgi:hypothetical protein
MDERRTKRPWIVFSTALLAGCGLAGATAAFLISNQAVWLVSASIAAIVVFRCVWILDDPADGD